MSHYQPPSFNAFALPVGSAVRLCPRAKSLLRITQGRVWVTLPSLPGDHFLAAGDVLEVPACDAVVLQALRTSEELPVYFAWDAAAVTLPVRARAPWQPLASPRPSYCSAVLTPLADLRAALVLGAGAVVRLALGVAALAAGSLLDAAIFLATSRARSSTV